MKEGKGRNKDNEGRAEEGPYKSLLYPVLPRCRDVGIFFVIKQVMGWRPSRSHVAQGTLLRPASPKDSRLMGTCEQLPECLE